MQRWNKTALVVSGWKGLKMTEQETLFDLEGGYESSTKFKYKNVRQTSIDAYHEIKESGLLSKRRMEVYDWLFHNGPATGNEVFQGMVNNKMITNANITTRLGELRDMGVAYEVGVVKCPVTGKSVIQWDVTGSLPNKVEKKATNYEKGFQDGYNKALKDYGIEK